VTQVLVILGFVINSVKMTVQVTTEKPVNLKTDCAELLKTTSPTIRKVESVIGKIVSSFPGVRYGPLQYRYLENAWP